MSLKHETSETIVVSISALFVITWILGAGWLFFRNVDFNRVSEMEPNRPSTPKAGLNVAPNQAQPGTSAAPVTLPPPVATFAKVPNVPSGKFSYSGTPAWEPIRTDVQPMLQAAWTPFQLRYTQPSDGRPNSRTLINMLLNDELAFAQSSRRVTKEEYDQATQRGFTFKEIPVAFDGIAVAVHPTLNIPGLTITQLKDIYLGKVMNWKEVGGPDLLITVYSGRKGDGSTINFFMESVLRGENFGANIQFISSTREALRQVESNTGGIYYGSVTDIVKRCDVKALPLGLQANALVTPYKEPMIPMDCTKPQRNQINPEAFTSGKYPLSRPLTVVVKQNGKEEQRAGEAYSQLLLTTEGQELITKTGFIGVR
ncbi:MAG: substrate-binding domain-containing protein [Coleofasciculaceae cyanobacterium]